MSEGKEYLLTARGNLKLKDKKLVTGDKVEFEGGAITKIQDRKSTILRPKVANCDAINLVVASTPSPDYLLIDKMIVCCVKAGVEVYITVNKCDVDENTANYVKENYADACDGLFFVSAESGDGIKNLVDALKGKLCCFAGQSAVGKTSLCNAIFGKNHAVNSVSEKTDRGRHTTTSREIHYSNDLFIVDTPGFSSFDIETVCSYDLMNYYKDFAPYNGKCYYVGCMHVSEPDCLVKEAVKNGKISSDRYDRYLTVYKEIKEYEKRKY